MNSNLLKRHSLNAIALTFLLFFFFSCSNEKNVIETNEAVTVQDTCSGNVNHIYEVYIPGNAKACSQLPLIIIIDPHGEGKAALKKFIPSADKLKCMLVASNLLKNNFENYLDEINALLEDVKAKYPTNGKLYLAGFSGGARMVLSFGQRNIVDGILAFGALATTNQIITLRAPVYAMIGMQDFNFIETAQYLLRPENTPGNLKIEISEEMHEWPSESELSNAIAYLILDGNSEKQICFDVNEMLSELSQSKVSQINSLKNKGDFLSAYLIAKNMALLHNEEITNHFQSLLNSLEFSQELHNDLNNLRESIRFELSVRDAYMKALVEEDLPWWKNEISSLNENIENDNDRFRNLAFLRIKAFLGIMCYTLTNKSLQSNNFKTTEKLLSVYQLIEPQNPDMFYFYALYSSKIGKINESKSYLQKAINAGFSDQKMIDLIKLQ